MEIAEDSEERCKRALEKEEKNNRQLEEKNKSLKRKLGEAEEEATERETQLKAAQQAA